MGTLVLPPQDQLSLHYSPATEMGFLSPHAALATKRKKQPRPTPFKPPPQVAYVERDLLCGMVELPCRRKASASPTSLAPQMLRAVVPGFSSSKPYYSHSHSSVSAVDSKERALRPASASGRLDSKADRNLPLEQNCMSAKEMPSKRSSFIKPSGLRILPKHETMVKQEQSFKPPSKKVEHADNSSFIGQENRPVSAEKIMSRSANSKRALRRTLTEGAVDTTPTPYVPVKVTILQRPKTKEDALLNLSKLSGVSLTQLYALNGLALSSSKGATAGIVNAVKPGNYSVVVGETLLSRKAFLAGEEDGNLGEVESMNSRRSSTVPSYMVQEQESLDLAGGDDSFGVQKEGSFFVEKTPQFLPSPVEIERNGLSTMSVSSDPDFLAEKWAGPCFAISPPPSSLPIPKFASLTRRKTETREEIESTHDLEGLYFSGFTSAPASPSNEEGLWHMHITKGEEVNSTILDTAVATKNLRRILNLDFQ